MELIKILAMIRPQTTKKRLLIRSEKYPYIGCKNEDVKPVNDINNPAKGNDISSFLAIKGSIGIINPAYRSTVICPRDSKAIGEDKSRNNLLFFIG